MDVLSDLIVKFSSFYITAFLILFPVVYYFFQTRSLPPGPRGLPYLGFYPFWDNKAPHKHLQELAKKYGDIFSLTITGNLFINLGSHKVLREAHITNSDCFATRPTGFTILGTIFEDGIFILNGDRWKTTRKFFTQQFRERGLNSLKSEVFGQTIDDTVKKTVEELRDTKGKPVQLINVLLDKCCKLMHVAVFGEHGATPEEIRRFNDNYTNMVQSLNGKDFLITGNVARYMVPFTPSYRLMNKYGQKLVYQMYRIIEQHKKTYEEGNVRNLIDAYFKERNERIAKNDPTAEYFSDKALMASMLQFVGDGVITVAVLISSFFQCLLEHPEEQEKIYKELVEVIGSDRNPNMEDKAKLVYTNAFVSEVIRTTDTFPFFPSLECTKDVNIGGYRIPKGAITVLNSWCIHRNPDDYEDPERFNPSRFLPVAGKKKVEQPVLFGIGKRSCVGEGYSVSQAFLFVTSIVKHFRITRANDEENSLLFLSGTLDVCLHPRTN